MRSVQWCARSHAAFELPENEAHSPDVSPSYDNKRNKQIHKIQVISYLLHTNRATEWRERLPAVVQDRVPESIIDRSGDKRDGTLQKSNPSFPDSVVAQVPRNVIPNGLTVALEEP